MTLPHTSAYFWLMLLAIGVSLFGWWKLARNEPTKLYLYFLALGSAFVGAKLVYLFAEGSIAWSSPQRIQHLLTGKSVTGALIGGYLGVELGKKMTGETAPTGDRFALIAPLGITIGRFGCLSHGCCLGAPLASAHWWAPHGRWPAVPVEIAFNLLFLSFAFVAYRRKLFPNQLFHIYLVAYGIFRLAHEFARATPGLWGTPVTGYQIAAVALVALGAIRYCSRRAWMREHYELDGTMTL